MGLLNYTTKYMKKEDAIPYIEAALKSSAEQQKITVSMLDDDARRKMAEWIYENFRV